MDIPAELSVLVTQPDAELSFDTVEGIGLDGSGCDGDPRFPYTWAKLTPAERERLQQYGLDNPDAR